MLNHRNVKMIAECPALRLPKIVRVMMQRLGGDKPTLYAAIRVSRTWFHHGVALLWHEARAHALLCIALERVQFYADKIVRFSVREADLPDRPLSLPRLRALSFDEKPLPGPQARVLQYIGPGLEELSCPYTDDVGERVKAQCDLGRLWRLRFFENYGDEYQEYVDPFIEWLTQQPALPRLESFQLSWMSLGAETGHQLLCYLAQQRQLTELKLDGVLCVVRLETLRQISLACRPVPRLRRLCLEVEFDAIPLLAQLVPGLTSLELVVEEARGVLQAVATLTQLEKLRLEFGNHASVRAHDLLVLRGLKHMRRFALLAEFPRDISISDADIVQLLSSWPMLERFYYEVEAPHSQQLLGRIGAACPSLVVLLYMSNCCLDCAFADAGHRAPLFPELESMTIGKLYREHDNCVRFVLLPSGSPRAFAPRSWPDVGAMLSGQYFIFEAPTAQN
jgi:hypothetical protein